MNESTNNIQAIASQENSSQPCPGCSIAQTSGAAYCPKCGRPLEEKSPQLQSPQATTAPTPAPQPTVESQPKAEPTAPTPPSSPSPLPQQQSPVPEARQSQGDSAQIETQPDVSQAPPSDSVTPLKQAPLPLKPTVEAPYHLVCTHQDGSHTVVDLLSDEMTIGSSPNCDLQLLGDVHISRQHAKLNVMGDKLVVQDMGSTNGSYLRLRKPTLMTEGDELLLGTTFVRLVHGPSPK